jgi:single-strand DNA-binding protein
MGRLTRNPEVKTVSEGVEVASFTLAVNRPKYGGKEQQADFIPVVAWRKTAEFVEKYFTKGMQVYVTGRIQVRSWDGEDGKKRYATDVVASEVGFAESKKNGEANAAGGGQHNAPAPVPEGDVDGFMPVEEDDLPF